MFIKQCKATHIKDLKKLPDKLETFYWAIKYDGHYCQLEVLPDKTVKFYTSSGKEFYEANLANEAKKLPPGIYEGEFLGQGDGKLGGRNEAAVATTLRTEFSKGIISYIPGVKLVIFDKIDDSIFRDRLQSLLHIASTIPTTFISFALYQMCSFRAAEGCRDLACSNGWEGIILKHPNHRQLSGKRVKNAIKLKESETIDLKVIDTIEGTGKYIGMIGALRCVDEVGNIVDVGSGLTDELRNRPSSYWVGKVIEVKCERKTETSYIHPVFLEIRTDK